jgi:carbamoylphosphate synthase large subunit
MRSGPHVDRDATRSVITVGVTAVGSGIGLAILRSLRAARIEVRVVGFDATGLAPALAWCDAARVVPRADDPGYLTAMLTACADEAIEVLIPGCEPELSVLAHHAGDFAPSGTTVIAAPGPVVDLCTDKLAFARFAAKHGLPFARTWTLADARDHAADLPYPVVAKPRTGAGSLGARIVADGAELVAIPGHADLIVQQWAGDRSPLADRPPWGAFPPQKDEVALQWLVGATGRILGRMGNVDDLKFGVDWVGRPVFDDSIVEQGRSTVEALVDLGLRGPINLQGRVDGTTLTLFEANARFSGMTSARTTLGFREVEAAIHALALGDEEAAIGCVTAPIADRIVLRFIDEVVVEPPAP